MRDDFKSLKCCLDLWLSNMLDCIHIYVCLFFEKLFLSNLDSFSIPLDSQAIYQAFCVFFIVVSTISRQILDLSRNFLSAQQMLDSYSIHRGWLLLDNFSTASRSVEILLHALFFTCFASFCYLFIHSILFHYIHILIWIP